jgi:hypothetical protein
MDDKEKPGASHPSLPSIEENLYPYRKESA